MEFSVFSDEHYMQEALKEAEIALEQGEVPVGAVIVCNRRIIARAYNQTEKLNDVTAHAEMIAITSAANYLGSKYLKDCSLYVTLEPCAMCAAAIGMAQLKTICYGAEDPKKGFSLFSPNLLHPKAVVSKGIEAKKCGHLLSAFFKEKRKK
jgi:tRNA(adenine34) deaminase